MTQHTPELWPEFSKHYTYRRRESRQEPSVILYGDEYIRARSCVNELAGKPEGYVKDLEKQLDELIKAVERYQKSVEECDTVDGLGMFALMADWFDLDDALAKARGDE